jgi:hypothetical protein
LFVLGLDCLQTLRSFVVVTAAFVGLNV